MNLRMVGITFVAAVAFAAFTLADNKDTGKKEDNTDKAFAQIVGAGPGVHRIKTDDKGRIQSCVVVGQSRISTVLGKAKGLEIARDRARLAASAEFRKWLKEQVSVHSKTEDEAILFLEGNEQNDKEALKESGKTVEKTSNKLESLSQGLVRGLQVLGSDVNDKERTYTVVMGWNAKTAAATKKVDEDLKDQEKKGAGDGKKPSEEDDAKRPAEPGKKIDKKIEDKRAVSPDFKKFLDK